MLIRVQALNKKFRKLEVLKNISVSFDVNQCIAIVGPNGSGKTTFIKSLLGLVVPDSGTINILDTNIRNNFLYRNHIGYMPQIGRYPENITIGQLYKMIKDVRQSVNPLDEDLIHQFHLPELFNKKMRTLSGGTRQKVSAALAFLFNPEILILDEPTAGLDPVSAEILKEKILSERKKNKLILITSHIMNDLDELCSHVMYMLEGNVEFIKTIHELKTETGEERLGKVMAKMMQQQNFKSVS
ncbi:MAG: ABC transporter ATP-binding protein [Sphingobacteriales bacterium]|nr:MAG: ABC transporter ATP-binding protein [Sphingobacteriales bacterium]